MAASVARPGVLLRAAAPLGVEQLRNAIWPADQPVADRVVCCRHCTRRNRVQVPRAVLEPERHRCADCGGSLFLGHDEPLVDLAPAAYQHSLDRRTVEALSSIPGVPGLSRWIMESVGDRAAQLLFMADTIQCGDDQFPELVTMVDRARTRLGLDFRPAVYLGESPYVNAETAGVKSPVIVVPSSLLDQMRDEEMLAILGHELGHLHAGHPLYQGVANALLYAGVNASSAVRLMGLPIRRVLFRWLRYAELTSDRAALLASRDLQACVSMMLTFAGGNRPGTLRRARIQLAPFLRQCRELGRLQAAHALNGFLGSYVSMDRTHPQVARRVIELVRWVEYGSYLNILSGHYLRRRSRRPALLGPARPALSVQACQPS